MSDLKTVGVSRYPGWRLAGGWVLLVVGLGVSFGYNFQEMWQRWFPVWRKADRSLYDRLVEGQSYYTHGPLVPLVSLLIVVLLVRHTRVAVRPSRRWGGLVLGGSLLLHLLASLARVNFASGFAFIGVLIGLVLLLWGTGALRRLWFPIALLALMVPLPEVTIAGWNFHLKMFAAKVGVTLATLVGVMIEQMGNRVLLDGGKELVIANVCNGLRTIISLLAFGAIYTYVCRLRGLWRLGLFAMTIPVALVSNSVRILSLIVVADIWDVETATGWYHDSSGILIFVLAFLMMFGLEKLILWAREAVGRPAKVFPLFHDVRRSERDEGQWGWMVARGGSPGAWVVGGVLLVVVAGGSWWLRQARPTTIDEKALAAAVPRNLVIGDVPHMSYTTELTDVERQILEYPGFLGRHYLPVTGGPGVGLTVIYSRDNRKGTHPPDLCLQGSGEGIVQKADVVVTDVPGRGEVRCRELVVATGDRKRYFLYTYKCGQAYTDSFWVQQGTIFFNGLIGRNAAGALVRTSTMVTGSLDEARKRCFDLMRAAVPLLDENLR